MTKGLERAVPATGDLAKELRDQQEDCLTAAQEADDHYRAAQYQDEAAMYEKAAAHIEALQAKLAAAQEALRKLRSAFSVHDNAAWLVSGVKTMQIIAEVDDVLKGQIPSHAVPAPKNGEPT